jgi:hypothetical protein
MKRFLLLVVTALWGITQAPTYTDPSVCQSRDACIEAAVDVSPSCRRPRWVERRWNGAAGACVVGCPRGVVEFRCRGGGGQ